MALSQFVALTARAAPAQERPLRVLVCEEDRKLVDLQGCVDAIERKTKTSYGPLKLTRFSSQEAPFGALPVAESWDLALLIPGPILDEAQRKKQLAPIEITTPKGKRRRPWLVVDVSAYGLVEIGPSLRPRAWTDLREGVRIPDLEREPGFLDVVAGLRDRRELTNFARIWWSVRADRTSAEIRNWGREARARKAEAIEDRELAILRLGDEEIESFEQLPTVRLGLAVSGRAREALRTLAAELSRPPMLDRLFGSAPRLRRHASRLAYPPSAERVRAARDFVHQRYSRPREDLPDWLNTVLLTLFVGVFAYVIARSTRARGRRGAEPPRT